MGHLKEGLSQRSSAATSTSTLTPNSRESTGGGLLQYFAAVAVVGVHVELVACDRLDMAAIKSFASIEEDDDSSTATGGPGVGQHPRWSFAGA
jgi:hypothetical protein